MTGYWAKLTLLGGIFLIILGVNAKADPALYVLTPSNVRVGFAVDNLWGLVKITGDLTRFTGTLLLDFNTPENSAVQVIADSASVSTGWDLADQMLMAGDYLNVAAYPLIRFDSDRVETKGTDVQVVHGHLTMRGVARDQDLIVQNDQPHLDGELGLVADFTVTGSFKRSDFGMTADQTIVSDQVEFFIHAQLGLKSDDESITLFVR